MSAITCDVGKFCKTLCGASRKRKLDDDVQLPNIATLIDDIQHIIDKSKQLSVLKKCENVTLKENWLIQQRVGVKVDDNHTICHKHRLEFVLEWKDRSSKCRYPGHLDSSKQKASRKISLEAILQTELLFSSPAKVCFVPVGSSWCNDCRLVKHPLKWSSNIHLIENIDDLCQICYKVHNSNEVKVAHLMIDETSQSSMSQEVSPTKECSDVEYSLSEDEESEQRNEFNESMLSLDKTWTPIKFQLNADLNTIANKTKKKIIKKANKAINVVLEPIAPGQVHELKSALFQDEDQEREETQLVNFLKETINNTDGRNTRIQLLSIFCKKDKEEKYLYSKADLIGMFNNVTEHDVRQARERYKEGIVGMPIESGKFHRKKLSDTQINHFLDFLQFGGVIQDVASGTRSVKMSSGRKTNIPNVVRTVHKAEIIRLYISSCEQEGYTEGKGRPTIRTLWNMLNNCPSSQRKSLAGLDNVASDGSTAFDKLISLCKTLNPPCYDEIHKDLIKSRRYLKGSYKAHCSAKVCSRIADHCRKFALSDPMEASYQEFCEDEHDQFCNDCEILKSVLIKIANIADEAQVSSGEKSNLVYDINQAKDCIFSWKAHILATVHQEEAKHIALENLSSDTAFIIIDFAMKFLSRKYRESMSSWFGKAGHGMHMSCVILRDQEEEMKFRKRTYISFTGKASQDTGCVIAIYQSLLAQVKTDFPNICHIIDKSDNAGYAITMALYLPGKAIGQKSTSA